MKICFFGSYDPQYARNKIILDGIQKNGLSVLHCRSIAGSIFVRYPYLIRQFWDIHKQIDVIYVAFLGHLNMPLAWVLGKIFRKKIVFDMFYSMYDTYIFDRRSAKEGSLRAFSYYWIDKLAVILADIVIIDTKTHGKYISHLVNLSPKKFKHVYVGGDDTVFKPFKSKKNSKCRVIFHGMFTRLHGAEYFVKAAKLLEDETNLEMFLVGSTDNYPLPIELYQKLKPKNFSYIPKLDIGELAKKIATSNISVGHLGTTVKAKSVITNKMFQAMAAETAVISGDCAANREVFTHRKTAWFVKMGDSKSLASAITFLCQRPEIVKQIAENGHILFKNEFTNKQIGHKLLLAIKGQN